MLELTGRTSLLELPGCVGLLESIVHTILLKLTERTGLGASAGRTDLLELPRSTNLRTSTAHAVLLESTQGTGLQ